ncbi:hypothetical protein [Mucilaginibacter terrae]|uniref:Uncharacterized protein n=1 Tax=Mucilaginibacter terrae TaxID=1955052 RepID=A0ABU3GUQ7_9SPHI|nr:hypothetical protein [Mucilaginibacter terrae]MDT3403516.1 hypothetical protein [Mucilaginibacter terrae]
MDTIPVKTIFDLQSEIIRLEKSRQEQEMVLKQRFSGPSAIISSIRSAFPKAPEGQGGGGIGSLFSPDLVSLVSRFVLPLALNKTLFRKSNFIIKTVVGLLSQKASTYISEDSVTSVWGRVKSLFGKKPSTARKPSTVK